jgi:hypothetical protein
MAKHHSHHKQLLSQAKHRLLHINSNSCNSSRSMLWHRPKLPCLGKLAEHPAESSPHRTIRPSPPASKALVMAALLETQMVTKLDDNSLHRLLVLALVLVLFLRLARGIAHDKAPELTWLLLSSVFAIMVTPEMSSEDLQRLDKVLQGASIQDMNAEPTD